MRRRFAIALGLCVASGPISGCKLEARHELDLEEAGHRLRFVEPLPVIPLAVRATV